MVTAKITYANMITDLCETFPGVDIDRVTEGVGSDYRIGNKYLTGGLGFGGPCFPRDNLATQALYIRKGLNNYKIPLDIHFFNRDIPTKVSIITKKISQDRFGGRKDLTIGVIGASYKNDTICLDESQAVSIIGYLSKIFYKVMVYQKGLSVEMLLDCMRSNLAMPHVHNVSVESDMSKIVEYSNIIILPVLDPQTIFQEFNEVISRYKIGDKYFIDCWRQMPDKPNVIKFGLYHPIRDVKLQHWAD
jgi:UDP-glucose 6-dehydrogenase